MLRPQALAASLAAAAVLVPVLATATPVASAKTRHCGKSGRAYDFTAKNETCGNAHRVYRAMRRDGDATRYGYRCELRVPGRGQKHIRYTCKAKGKSVAFSIRGSTSL